MLYIAREKTVYTSETIYRKRAEILFPQSNVKAIYEEKFIKYNANKSCWNGTWNQ